MTLRRAKVNKLGRGKCLTIKLRGENKGRDVKGWEKKTEGKKK